LKRLEPKENSHCLVATMTTKGRGCNAQLLPLPLHLFSVVFKNTK